MSSEDLFPDPNPNPNFSVGREYWEERVLEEIKTRTYLDPLYDVAFKVFLGDSDALKSFLNGVFRLEGEKRITSVMVKPTEINIVFPRVKSFRLDIRAETSNGFRINVEMQKARHSRFVERVLLQHSAFMLQSKYEWDQEFFSCPSENLSDAERARREISRYEIPPTYAIWVCDFPMEQQDGYRGTWAIRNEKGLPMTDKVKYILYDLTRFTKSFDSLDNDEDRWLYLLKHAGKSETLPDFHDDIIARAIDRLLVKNASDKLLKEQAANMVMTEEELDYLASLKVRAREEGRAEGHERGLLEGREQGLAEGLAEGRAEGLAEGRAEGEMKGHDDAISVLQQMGLSPEQIAEAKAKLAALDK